MLDWLTGGGQQSHNAMQHIIADDQSSLPEPPETPAPVFALRAFKTAIFGTPREAEPEGDSYVHVHSRSSNADGSTKGDEERKTDSMKGDLVRPINSDTTSVQERNRDDDDPPLEYSPTKPGGILMTPGTATARRKTVSFGPSVVDNEGKAPVRAPGKSGLPSDYPGKFPSPWTPRTSTPATKQKRTSLTESLYRARDSNKANPDQVSRSQPAEVGPTSNQPRSASDRSAAPDQEGLRGRNSSDKSNDDGDDVTTNLNEPHSQSGRFWKQEYEQYQSKSRNEMRKLLKYKQIAKSYAKKKDEEAMNLGERLQRERKKVTAMEQKISELAGEIAAARKDKGNDGQENGKMMKDLARQTALALEYKAKVDQFESELLNETQSPSRNYEQTSKRFTSPQTESTLLRASEELKQAREQLKEMNKLRTDVAELRKSLDGATKKAEKLDHEKAVTEKYMARMKEEMNHFTNRGRAKEERRRERELKLEIQNKEYKERLNQSRSEHDKVVSTLQKRIEELQGAESRDALERKNNASATAQKAAKDESERKVEEQGVLIESLKQEVAELKKSQQVKPKNSDEAAILEQWQEQNRKTVQELRRAREEAARLRLESQEKQHAVQEAHKEIRRLKALVTSSAGHTAVSNSRPNTKLDASKESNVVSRDQHAPPLTELNVNANNEHQAPNSSSKRSPNPSASQCLEDLLNNSSSFHHYRPQHSPKRHSLDLTNSVIGDPIPNHPLHSRPTTLPSPRDDRTATSTIEPASHADEQAGQRKASASKQQHPLLFTGAIPRVRPIRRVASVSAASSRRAAIVAAARGTDDVLANSRKRSSAPVHPADLAGLALDTAIATPTAAPSYSTTTTAAAAPMPTANTSAYQTSGIDKAHVNAEQSLNGTPRTRSNMPASRAAAAKARLEAKVERRLAGRMKWGRDESGHLDGKTR
ncbi:MAG: hypothetical protein M1819_007199 [Sarea resinae]|nr:MAG: hypothetical protein M1819_007199 [Sarea resinae]